MIKNAGKNERININHTFVPGSKRGFGITYFPKEINNLYSLMKKITNKV